MLVIDNTARRYPHEPYATVKERLASNGAYLTSFLFHRGANFYVFSYRKEGATKHTFIDSGDARYRNEIRSILTENDINLVNVERVIITHRHADHCGLAHVLARESKAQILAHASFRRFVESGATGEERRWLGDFQPANLRECDIVYLSPPAGNQSRSINGLDFPSLLESVDIGDAGTLAILASPESTPTHSPDQIVVLYSPRANPEATGKAADFLPTDDIVFAGDLWLMRGPQYSWGKRDIPRHLRYGLRRVGNFFSGKGNHQRDSREQDAPAKDALKRGFGLVRVKPGHGEEFIGSRIIPNGLLADRDLLPELGYPLNTDTSVLRAAALAPKIARLMEQAYASFARELLLWTELGYTLAGVSELLRRIYREQSGGGPLVAQDRKQRRERLKSTLLRLRNDTTKPGELRELAAATLVGLKGV